MSTCVFSQTPAIVSVARVTCRVLLSWSFTPHRKHVRILKIAAVFWQFVVTRHTVLMRRNGSSIGGKLVTVVSLVSSYFIGSGRATSTAGSFCHILVPVQSHAWNWENYYHFAKLAGTTSSSGDLITSVLMHIFSASMQSIANCSYTDERITYTLQFTLTLTLKASVHWHCCLGIKKSIRPVKNWVMRCWCGYLSRVRCRLFAFGPADATACQNSIVSCLI